MEFAIRQARAGEEERVLAMYEWLFEPPGYRPPQWDEERALAALREAVESPGSAVFVAELEEQGRLVGLCTAYLELNSVRYGQRCWVEDLVVNPDHRSQGIGDALLDAASDWARARGATHFELDTGKARVDAQRFYERRDPTTVGVAYSWVL